MRAAAPGTGEIVGSQRLKVRSTWGTIAAAGLAGFTFAVFVLVQRHTFAGPPATSVAVPPAAQSESTLDFLQIPSRVVPVATVVTPGAPSTVVGSESQQPKKGHRHKHGEHRVPPSTVSPSCDDPNHDGVERSSLNPQADETGPVSSILGPITASLPPPLGGDGGVTSEVSCAVAALGG